jgi:hypothetical protein
MARRSTRISARIGRRGESAKDSKVIQPKLTTPLQSLIRVTASSREQLVGDSRVRWRTTLWKNSGGFVELTRPRAIFRFLTRMFRYNKGSILHRN